MHVPCKQARCSIRDQHRTVLTAVPMPGAGDTKLMSVIKTLHSNLGHPSSRSLARAIKLSGGSDAAVKAALEFRCSVCTRLKEPKPANPAKLDSRWKKFGDLVCVDLFTLSDVDENQWSFLNAVDKVSGYQLCAPVRSKRPDEVLKVFTRLWLTPFGIPHNVLADGGGEFEREFGGTLEDYGATILKTAAYSPTQNSTAERRGGAWKAHAKAVMSETCHCIHTEEQDGQLCTATN